MVGPQITATSAENVVSPSFILIVRKGDKPAAYYVELDKTGGAGGAISGAGVEGVSG